MPKVKNNQLSKEGFLLNFFRSFGPIASLMSFIYGIFILNPRPMSINEMAQEKIKELKERGNLAINVKGIANLMSLAKREGLIKYSRGKYRPSEKFFTVLTEQATRAIDILHGITMGGIAISGLTSFKSPRKPRKK